MDYPFQAAPFAAVLLTGGFWRERQDVNRSVTLPFALSQCEQSGRLENFDLAAQVSMRRSAGEHELQFEPRTLYPFDDTDVYKVLEAACYVLGSHPDPALASRLDAWIERVAAAQEPDGYLYTFRTMHPDSPAHPWCGSERWVSDPELSHELYNVGHLYEAGVAHFEATGCRTLLDVCLRSAELLWREFGDGGRRLAPGHPIVEMGLVKLHRATNDARWLKLARIFLEARGPGGPAINQRHERVVDQAEAVGHAVRANYLYAGMADVAALDGAEDYLAATKRIWENVVSQKLYLTGGAGALADGEAYGASYELPLDGYAETCAAAALMFWSHRLFLLSGEGRYMDVFERAAYNGFVSGVSLEGKHFFYSNPLEHDGVAKNNHGHAGRAPWFGCACCPPNLMRTLAAFASYLYAVRSDSLYVNVYAASDGVVGLEATRVRITQLTDYPWSGRIRLQITPDAPAAFTLHLRIPGWARGEPVPSVLYRYEDTTDSTWTVHVNGEPASAALLDGYAAIEREWRAGDSVELQLPMPARRVRGHDRIDAVRGRVAFERGPIVYCVEQSDLGMPLVQLAVPPSARLVPVARPSLLGGVTALRVEGASACAFDAVPYHAWNNRGLAPMSVWLPAEAGA